MENIRVYLVNVDQYEFNTNLKTWDDDKFISEAEIQGNVYTLKGFERSFNTGEVSTDNCIIRVL